MVLKRKLKEIKPSLPPSTTLEVSFDRSNYIKAAINEVYKTLFIALILVTIIIYLFLGNIRALVVPNNCFTCFFNFNIFINLYIWFFN